jgi:alpha-mannosidase
MSTQVEIDKILSLEEIIHLYPSEWVLIAYTELDEDLNVIRGEVLAHSPERFALQ